MKTRTPIVKPWLIQLCLLLVIIAGCAPVSTQPPEQPTLSAAEPQQEQAAPSPTITSEDPIPVGWTTYTSQSCEYNLSYPSDMQVSYGGIYSRTLSFNLANPEEGARNFIYLSVINQEYQNLTEEIIYNYTPSEADLLLKLQVGESKSLRNDPQNTPGFTYQRLPDTTIGGYAAQTYENTQPWEFPDGTKEIRYYLTQDGCTYLIGGYLDTAQSNQSGAITENLFHQVVETIKVTP